MKKVDLNALRQLSNIELFLLLCGTVTAAFTVPPTMVRTEEPVPPQTCDD